MDETYSDNLNTLFKSITGLDMLAPTSSTSTRSKPPRLKVTIDNVEEFVLKSSEELINAGLESVDELKDIVVQGQNPDEIESLASLINSTTNAIEVLNKTVLLKKKNESTKELKLLDIENRKEVNNTLNNTTINNTNVIVASREEIFKKFLKSETKTQNCIDITTQDSEIKALDDEVTDK